MYNPQDHMDQLVRLLKYYDYEFHIKGNQIISEYERDSLRSTLEKLEYEYPQYSRPDSPTMVIGVVEEGRPCIHRISPMLSLRHSYDLLDIEKWLDPSEEYIIESKFDGVAVSALYIDGIMDSLSLRGNGYSGEEITHFAPYIHNLPMNLHKNLSITIRGEVCLPKSDNRTNKRNIMAGYLRQKQPKQENGYFIPYELIVENAPNTITYLHEFRSQDMEFLREFMNIEPYIVSHGSMVMEKIMELHSDNYETDGVVIKFNKNMNMGANAKYSKNAIAYKFSNVLYETIVENIMWNINRVGHFIPLIIVNSVNIDGCQVGKLTGHNRRYLWENSIGIGSKIEIERVGNTVPQIKNILSAQNNINEPSICEHCNGKLTVGDIHITCINENCPGIISKQIAHFFNQLDIHGLASNIIERFPLQNSYLESLEYIIRELNGGQWIQSKHDSNAFANYNNKRKLITFQEFMGAIGVCGVSDVSKMRGIAKDRFHEYLENNREILNRIFNLLPQEY